MVNSDDYCYFERLLCFEDDKRKLQKEHPEYTAAEYEKAVKDLADKWDV